MAVTISAAALATAIRLGDSTEETAQSTRLLAVATEIVTRYAPDAPDAIQDESVIRVAGYLYDAPQSVAGHAFADVIRNSGALALLAPYRVHRLGVADAE